MSVKLLCLGDVMLGENFNHYKRSIRTRFQPDYKKLLPPALFEYIENEVDLIFYNFEYSLAEEKDFLNKRAAENVYKGTPETLLLFSGSKIAVNIANNHFGEHGSVVCRFTKQLLKQHGIHIIGENNAPVIVPVNDLQLYFFGASLVKDKHGHSDYFKADYTSVLDTLRLPETKAGHERWIISLHWGDEYLDTPSAAQNTLARALIDRGFDLIIGHHPHTVQPVEYYKDKLIIYSLGNFIFDQNFSRRTQTGLVINVLLDPNPGIAGAFFSYQKKYRIYKLKKIPLKNLIHTSTYTFYSLKKKLFSYWYRLLMKLEVLANFHELDKETIEDFVSKIRSKTGRKKANSGKIQP